jgi:hypothetical protein
MTDAFLTQLAESPDSSQVALAAHYCKLGSLVTSENTHVMTDDCEAEEVGCFWNHYTACPYHTAD